MPITNNLYLHCFNLVPQIGPARILRLAKYFNQDFQLAFSATAKQLTQAGLEPDIIELWLAKKSQVNFEQEQNILKTNQIQLLSYLDTQYPKLLLEISKFPPLLYVRGTLPTNDAVCFSVVGSRKITTYGLSVMPDILNPIIACGAIIVSGMAFGVDGEAHKLALKQHQKTVAVLGGGLDTNSLYPKQHQFLAQEILANQGCLISEYPPFTPNFKQHFIARNRIIAGLSVGTLVIECGLDSGSLITANHALEQNRQIYAVPGPIYASQSQGPNNLIKMGAKLVTSAEDILEDLNLKSLPEELQTQELFSPNPTEQTILTCLSKTPTFINDIIKLSKLSPSEVASTLTFLEMKGKIRNLGGQQYVISR
jgi:DNA processing protein